MRPPLESADFATIRVPLGLPPGFDDARKATSNSAASAAGDYLLWSEVLDYARKHETDIVLVTDDAKSDWWQTGGDGLPNVPHPLLVSEFRRETGQNYFQLSTRDLLRRADVLDITVTPQNLEEEDELAATAEAEGARELLADFGGRLTVGAAVSAVENDFRRRFSEPWAMTESQSQRLIDAGQRALGPGAQTALYELARTNVLHEFAHTMDQRFASDLLTPEMKEMLGRLGRQQFPLSHGTRRAFEPETPLDDDGSQDDPEGPAE